MYRKREGEKEKKRGPPVKRAISERRELHALTGDEEGGKGKKEKKKEKESNRKVTLRHCC